MNLFKTRTVKHKPEICNCRYCGNPQVEVGEKCFYCRQLQPTQPILVIDNAIDLETLHGVKKERERPMSYVDIAPKYFQGIREPRLIPQWVKE